MATNTIARKMSNFESRALLSETSLAELKKQLSNLQKSFASKQGNIVNNTLQYYDDENQKLKDEIKTLKSTLTYLQIQNGVKVIPLPQKVSNDPVSSKESAAPIQSNGSASNAPNQKETKKEKTEQQPKKGKAKGGETAKKAAADDSKPVHVGRLDLRIGKIVDVKPHPDADSLYVEQVDVGEEKPRTILSGLVKHVPIEKMKSIKAIFLCNLKPAKMRGILSEGMIMCASTPEKVEIIKVPDEAQIGDNVICQGYEAEPDKQLNPKKKIWEQIQPELKISSEGHATYKGVDLTLPLLGHCWAPTMKDCPIK